MKFGNVPIAEAVGSILAHSVRLKGSRLRKGTTLSSLDIANLSAAGIHNITVATLATDDLSENRAAQKLAEALVPDAKNANMRLSRAFTGRVNIFATIPCVVRLQTDRLVQLNNVDPMITLATVPDYTQMATGGMIATVKIISYGVANAALERVCKFGRDALNVAVPIYRTAKLIITDTPGGPGTKGIKAIETRLQALGMNLQSIQTVPHQVAYLKKEIIRSQADMILILAGSATSDRMDVAPEALRRAGGTVTRFGIPVDPGNLLFYGELRGRPVIGLPGCARSPALNGADWVLSRLACGLQIANADIARMGIGGLLKESGSRLMPRERKPR